MIFSAKIAVAVVGEWARERRFWAIDSFSLQEGRGVRGGLEDMVRCLLGLVEGKMSRWREKRYKIKLRVCGAMTLSARAQSGGIP